MKDVRNLAMRAFVGLLVVNALVAIAAIVGATGSSDWEVVGTTLLLTAGCLTVAANAAALERDRLWQLPYVGAGLSCLAFGVFIWMIWVTPESDNDVVFKVTFVALTFGLAATYASVLAIPTLGSEGFAIARLVGYGTVGVLAAVTAGVIVAEGGVSGQVFAVLSVILATATIIVLTGAIIESRASRLAGGAATSPGLHCPSCTAAIASTLRSGSHTCPRCGLGFSLDITAGADRRVEPA